MKPLNSHTAGCDPVSSNCVIWQGPDIPCLKLCKGDTVSDVVYKLATELCDLLTALDVTTYTLPSPCFANQACTPQDFHDLIQIIINKICDLEECTNCGSSGERLLDNTTGCPDCVVEIASCFYYTNEFGDQVTTMQLADYTRAIGNKLCDLVNQITLLNAAVSDLDLRVTALENAPAPTLVLPQVTPVCVLSPSVPTNMNLVLSTLEQQFCQLVTVTGSPNAMSQAITRQCLNLSSSPVLGPSGGNMSTIPGWIISANTVASSLNNMWLTLCDLRAAVRTIQLTCCPSGCDGIDFVMQASFTGTALTLFFTGTIPPGFQECDPLGNRFRISDTLGNSITTNIITTNYFNDPIGYGINLAVTPLNPASDLTVTSDICFTDPSTNTTCQFCVTAIVTNQSICPTLSVISNPGGTQVVISFSPAAIPGSYSVELWDASFSGILDSQTQYLTTYSSTNYTFAGLAPSTVYNARVVITVGPNVTECGYVTFTTNPVLCLPPTGLSAAIELPVLCDTCGPALEFSDNPTVDGTYVDVTSDYLLTYSGGTFNSIYTEVYDASMVGVPSPATMGQRASATTLNGDTYISYNDSTLASASIIYHYDNTGTLVNTITLTFGGAASVRCNNMDYSEFDGKIYFISHSTALTNPLSVYVLDPSTDTYTKLTGISAVLIGFPQVYANPLNGHLMFPNNVGSTQIGNPATDTMINTGGTAIPQAGLPIVNRSTGEVWIMRNNQNTHNIWDLSGASPVNVGTATAPVGYLYRGGSANGVVRGATYYPGDGTTGTDRVFAVFDNSGAGVTDLIEFDASSPYTASVFTSLPTQSAPVSIIYSYNYNKLLFTYSSNTLEAYNPTDSAIPYASITITGGSNMMWPYEDTLNKQIVYFTFASSPTKNIFWIGLDTTNAVQCTQGVVDMYLGNSGPYEFNSSTLSWDAMCTSSVSVVGTTITANATLSASVTFAALLYSTDYGLTWLPLIDNGGSLYANPAVWLAGRTFTKPAGAVQAKVSFSTNNDCGLEGIVMNL